MIARLVPLNRQPQSVPWAFHHCKLEVLKAKWRDQVMDDLRLTASYQVIGYWLADHMTMDLTRAKYKETGQIVIWPSQQELANRTGFHINTVVEGIASLIRHGHLVKLRQGNQFTSSNRYQVIVKPPKAEQCAYRGIPRCTERNSYPNLLL
jgi:DNA-binding transcriptional regulator YhcF (GntR family)